VVTFTGFSDTTREEDGTPYSGGSVVDRERGLANCVEGYKKIAGLAEQNGVNICLEPLNTRDAGAMKGHPGYQGAHLDYCLEVIRKVGSPRLKLLFDVYHVQIMDGDLIRRIGEIGGEAIGHVQVAGVPGRHELDDSQEVNWRAVMGALERAGYRGFVGLEFLPTRDPMESLAQALEALGLENPA
jgi:hydroxypyruvate isomerase